MNNLLLDILAFGAIISGIMVITAKNPVISVLFLIAVFVNVAGYLVLLGVAYLGLVYLIVYVGAIAILFLFVIMMLNLRLVELIQTGQEYTKSLPLGAFLGSLFLFELLSFLPITFYGPENYFFSIFLTTFNLLNIFILQTKNNIDTSSLSVELKQNNIFVYSIFSSTPSDNNIATFTQIESIGQGLYTYATIWLIIASIIFLLAMVGPIVLCMNSNNNN